MSDFNITLFEACEFLNRSKKSISRYIRRDLLHPERIRSQQGTLEYRFSKADLETFKEQEAQKAKQSRQDTQDRADKTEETDQTGHIKSGFIKDKGRNDQSRQDKTDQTRQDSEVIMLFKEMTRLLRNQLKTKDWQIGSLGKKIDNLIERDRETNIILKGLQDKVFMLESPKEPSDKDLEAETYKEPQKTENKPTEAIKDTTSENKAEVREKPKKRGFFSRLFSE